jgi:hypothetical protein
MAPIVPRVPVLVALGIPGRSSWLLVRTRKTVGEDDEMPRRFAAGGARRAGDHRTRRGYPSLSSFDFDAVPTISKALVMALVAGGRSKVPICSPT